MASPSEPDSIDWRLLSALQENAALTNAELAERAGVSPSQVSRRRQRLEADGLIRGYHAALDPERVGLGVVVFIHVTLAAHSPKNAQRFRDLVKRVGDVLEAHAMTGESDYMLKVALPGLKDLAVLVNDVLLPHESIARVRSEIVLETLKDTRTLPLPVEAHPPRGKA